MATKPYIIALEEHYYDPEVKRQARGLDAIAAPETVQRLDDLGELRLQEMDEAGIDLQVLSHTMPGLQKLDAATAVPLARRATTGSTKLSALTPTGSPALLHCQLPIPSRRPTSSNARSTSSASRARW